MVAIRGHARRGGAYAALGIAALFLIGAGPSNHPAQPEGAGAKNGSAQQPSGAPDRPMVFHLLPAPKTAEEAAEDAQERKDKRASDAQMGALTGALALIGFLQLLVFGYQALKLRETVRDGEKAIAAATAAAQASSRQAEAAEKALTLIERPYLFIGISGQPPFNPDKLAKDGKAQPQILFQWGNMGRTPAIGHRYRYQIHIGEKLPLRPYYSERPRAGEYVWGAGKTSEEEKWIYIPGITKAEGDEILSGKKHIFFFGDAEYDDVLDNRHITGFGIMYLPKLNMWTAVGGKAFNFRRTRRPRRSGGEG